MAITIPNPLTGRFVAQVKLTAQTVASNGDLTDAGGASDIAILQNSTGDPYAGSPTALVITVSLVASLEFGIDTSREEISSLNRPYANHVRLAIAPRCTVQEIRRQAVDTNRLAALWHNGVSRYVKYEFARAGNFWLCYGVITDCNEDAGKGQNLTRLTIAPCGIAPTYSPGVRSS